MKYSSNTRINIPEVLYLYQIIISILFSIKKGKILLKILFYGGLTSHIFKTNILIIFQYFKYSIKEQKDKDKFSQERFDKMYKEQLEEKNKKLDEKAEKNAKEFILEFIKANMNRSYFDEDRADLFFEKVFAL